MKGFSPWMAPDIVIQTGHDHSLAGNLSQVPVAEALDVFWSTPSMPFQAFCIVFVCSRLRRKLADHERIRAVEGAWHGQAERPRLPISSRLNPPARWTAFCHVLKLTWYLVSRFAVCGRCRSSRVLPPKVVSMLGLGLGKVVTDAFWSKARVNCFRYIEVDINFLYFFPPCPATRCPAWLSVFFVYF